jgi:hypothetical protein
MRFLAIFRVGLAAWPQDPLASLVQRVLWAIETRLATHFCREKRSVFLTFGKLKFWSKP